MATVNPPQSIDFLALPLELREEIYNHVFQTTDLESGSPRCTDDVWLFRFSIFQFPLASTCRQIRDELLAALKRADLPIQIAQLTDWDIRRHVRFIFARDPTSLQGRGGMATKPPINLGINTVHLGHSLSDLKLDVSREYLLQRMAEKLKLWTVRVRHRHRYEDGRLTLSVNILDAWLSQAHELEPSREAQHDCVCGCMSPGKT